MIWFEGKAANSTGGWRAGKTGALAKLTGVLSKLAFWQNWRSGKTGALAKLALWQNWRSGKTDWRSDKTGVLAKLALWQNWHSSRWIKSQKHR